MTDNNQTESHGFPQATVDVIPRIPQSSLVHLRPRTFAALSSRPARRRRVAVSAISGVLSVTTVLRHTLLTWFVATLWAASAAGVSLAAEQSVADAAATTTPVRFTFDRPVDGASAPFVVASAKGYFRSEALGVTTDIAKTPDDAITRIAQGASDIAVADLNALIRFRDTPNAPAVKAVFVLFNTAPYAIIARKSRGIATLSDLGGKTLGVATGDLSIRLWPALADRNGIAIATVKQQAIGAAVREPMLAAGQVDAVTGFSYLSAVNLRDRGIPADDLTVLRFADYGCPAYGAVLIVNPKFAAEKPEAVRAFLRATMKGLRQTIKNPGAAIDAVMAQMNGGERLLELERLRIVLRDNILTNDVRRNGFGAADTTRLNQSITALAHDRKFREKPLASDIFDPAFLPPATERQFEQATK
ncbi:MAG: ABC transporter substrate-binding protein [Rhizobiales bacterium]|nr:ABC transporter substrate-binding protein [Hyphomicrobiales bacterium]